METPLRGRDAPATTRNEGDIAYEAGGWWTEQEATGHAAGALVIDQRYADLSQTVGAPWTPPPALTDIPESAPPAFTPSVSRDVGPTTPALTDQPKRPERYTLRQAAAQTHSPDAFFEPGVNAARAPALRRRADRLMEEVLDRGVLTHGMQLEVPPLTERDPDIEHHGHVLGLSALARRPLQRRWRWAQRASAAASQARRSPAVLTFHFLACRAILSLKLRPGHRRSSTRRTAISSCCRAVALSC